MRYGATRLAIAGSLLWLIGCWSTVAAFRILACEPSPGHSHWNVMSAVLESLLAAGHEVVCATAHPATDRLAAHPNYTHVDMSSLAGGQLQAARDLDYAQVMRIFRSNAFVVGLATTRARRACEHVSDMPEMRDMLNGGGGRKFDAVVLESLHSECMSALPDRLGLPAVYVVPSPTVNWMPVATGAPDHPSYLGTLLADRPTPVTFGHRLVNALVYAQTTLVRWYNDAGRDHRWPKLPNAMVFVNTHHSVEPGRPTGPNVLEIGGIHLNRPLEQLPRDLADVMNESNEFGVIVFTFGSLVAMDTLPDDVLRAFKIVFSQLPQTVIWKYENDHMPDKPENVMLCKWLPQRAILQHPNVKLFISHGGMSGVYEVVDAGVPVLGMPLFYDQPRNIQNLVDLGMALSIKINNLTQTTLSEAINRLIKDQRRKTIPNAYLLNCMGAMLLFLHPSHLVFDHDVFWRPLTYHSRQTQPNRNRCNGGLSAVVHIFLEREEAPVAKSKSTYYEWTADQPFFYIPTKCSFSENAKRVSSLFRDRPMKPSESVVYWVEYLIRHTSEANIRPLSADASWTSHFMLDICAALVATLLTLWFVMRAIVHVVLYKFIPSAVK